METTCHRVDFQELMDPQALSIWEGQQVQIYGFLHQVPERGWILSTTATLRSCCLEEAHVRNGSIWLTGDTSDAQRLNAEVGSPILLEGTLLSQKTSHKEPVWVLKAPRVIQSQGAKDSFGAKPALFGGSICALLLLYFLFTFMLKRFSSS